jgi:SAM-dependent methyltransferase
MRPFWNGSAGDGWVSAQPLLDHILQPFESLLVQAARDASATRVLDVGCGTGATTLAIARSAGAIGRCVGVDISGPMIEVARARAKREDAPVDFICADAQRLAFAPASYDMIVSRFGVMFFDDPIRAFGNLRRAAAQDAKLVGITWRGTDENAFMTTAERYAAPLLPNIPVRKPGEPGQFALADESVIRNVLRESGWAGINIEPIDVACAFPEAELLNYITRLGPVGRMLHDMEAGARSHIARVVRDAFEPYVHGDEVHFDAACWRVGARA